MLLIALIGAIIGAEMALVVRLCAGFTQLN